MARAPQSKVRSGHTTWSVPRLVAHCGYETGSYINASLSDSAPAGKGLTVCYRYYRRAKSSLVNYMNWARKVGTVGRYEGV